jgi:LmbE family N-acetylglucosaminyl deacetylase
MPDLADAVPATALAVYAHPDDAEISCGGTLARWAAAGAAVHVVVCAKGDKGSLDPTIDPAALADTRAAEMEAAARVLGLAGHHVLGWSDGEVDNTVELRAALVRLIRDIRPVAVLCPDPTSVFFGDGYINHRDHRNLGWAVLDAVAPAAGNPHYFPEAGPPHVVTEVYLSGTHEPTVWVDVGACVEVKLDAVFCHKSQLPDTSDAFRDYLRERAEESGRVAGIRFAEGFRRLTLAAPEPLEPN